MNRYNEKQLEENYNKFLEAIKKSLSGERLDKVLHMYSMDELGPNLMLSPASSNRFYHNAYEGGYIDHVMNVARNSLRMMKLFSEAGGVITFSQEELLFAAFHHDLGKLGQKGKLHYISNDSEWHIANVPLKKVGNKLLMVAEDGNVFDDETIVEFKYDPTKPKFWQWTPIRVRLDKTADYRSGGRNYGNAYHVAQSVWRSIHNPVTESMITTGKNILMIYYYGQYLT